MKANTEKGAAEQQIQAQDLPLEHHQQPPLA